MNCSKPPQCEEEKLFLCGFEVVFCEALTKLSETARGEQIWIATYEVQNLDT